MKTRHIAIKLGLVFGLLLALLAGVGFFGLDRMDRSNATLQAVFTRNWVTVRLAREALAYSTQNSRLTMEVFLINDQDEIGAILTKRAENTRKIGELVSKIEPLCD